MRVADVAASGVRRDLGLKDGRVDVFGVARALGLEVYRYPAGDDGIDGQYRPAADGVGAIFVNSSVGSLRQRFTVAHEIGHALLNPSDPVVDEDLSAPGRSMHERQADWFAGALLVDGRAALKLFRESDRDVDAAVARVVERFEVSIPAAAIALERIGVITGAECQAFIVRYRATTHAAFMRAQGARSRSRPGDQAIDLDPAFQGRVLLLLSRGRLSPEVAAERLLVGVAELPAEPVSAYRRLEAAVAARVAGGE
jgi:Zn-dependent peptidase ImmA (M78 family)